MKKTKNVNTFLAITLSVLMGIASLAGATELPQDLVDLLNVPGITIGDDGSVFVGSAQFVPFFPTGYDSAAIGPIAPEDITINQDGTVFVPGGIQFVPILQNPGEYPAFIDNFTPLPDTQLPPDFLPPPVW